MTDDEIRIAVAECCGWKHTPKRPNPGTAGGMLPEQFTMGNLTTYSCPNFPADLNACAEMEETLGVDESYKYGEELRALSENVGPRGGHFVPNGFGCYALAHLTARQRCEAFLKVKGLWKP